MKRLLPFLFVLLLSAPAFATTYYASPSGGGAASCVDSGANVCTLARAVVVAGTGTNTIQGAAGTYNITTELSLGSGNTGANLTFTCATTDGCTWASSGSTTVVDIETTMVSGTVTFDDITIDDGSGSDYGIRNQSPEVNVVFKNGTINNSDASAGYGIYATLDATNKISLTTGEDTVTNLKTGATTNVKVAQKIVVGGSGITVNRSSMKLQRRCGNNNYDCDTFVSGESWDYRNAETLTFTIETDSAGAPSGTPVTNGTAKTVRAFDVPFTSDQWVFFTFSSNVSLSASTTYWLVITGSYAASTSNYIAISTDTSNGYASGDCATFDGTNWTGCAAGTDLLFTIDRNHSRTLTVQDSTFTTRSSPIVAGWHDTITVQRNTLTSTASGIISITANGFGTTAGPQCKKFIFDTNVLSSTNAGSLAINIGSSTFAFTYIETAVITNNTGSVQIFLAPERFVRRIFIKKNTMDLTYTGNNPFHFGEEVNGSDPQELVESPLEQIVIEKNRFNYTGGSHNHLLGIFMGASNGIFRDNTMITSGTGAWGLVLKADGWLIDHNNLVNVAPGIYVSGTNNSRIINNTIYCSAATTDGCLLVRTHQDNIYGGKHGIPYYSYIKDNIVYMTDSTRAAYDWGSATDSGPGRTTQYWSVISDNNIYWAPNNSTRQAQIVAPGGTEDVTVAEGIATVQSTFQNATYTDSTSLSYYNDLNSYFTDPGLIDPANGNFKATSSTAKNNGSITNTSIGSYQSSGGMKWVGSRR